MTFFILLLCFVVVHGNGIHQPHHPQPYSFGYTIKDHGGVQHRQEAGNGAGIVKGNYGFVDNKGIMRQVDYTADHAGFRAQVKTNEPGTSGQSPAAVNMMAKDSYVHGAAPYVAKVNDHMVPNLHESDGVYGFPALYGHRAHSYENHEPTKGYRFITPVREQKYDMPSHMPAHPRDLHRTVQIPVQHRDYRMPVHVPVQHRDHPMPFHVPVQQHSDHYMPADVAFHDYDIPHQAPSRMPVHHVHNPLQTYDHSLNPMYGPRYMGGLAHGNLLGAGYRGHGGNINYAAKLVGGVIRGHDSRLAKL